MRRPGMHVVSSLRLFVVFATALFCLGMPGLAENRRTAHLLPRQPGRRRRGVLPGNHQIDQAVEVAGDFTVASPAAGCDD